MNANIQDIERHIEPYIKELVAINEIGAYVDIPQEDYAPMFFMQAIGKFTYRYITKPLKHQKGTYRMSIKDRKGFTRVTLMVQVPGT